MTAARDAGPEALADWADEKDAICRRIVANSARLKIVLKTRDETDFLQRWIDHHSKIAGLANLVIFDNYSTEDAVHRIYDGIRDEAVVVRFGGYHNDLHKPTKFPELYEALQASADYFILLDTDEEFVWLKDGETYARDASILNDLEAHSAEPALPGIWLANVTGFDDRFHLFARDDSAPIGTRLGKTLFSSRAQLSERVCHNFQAENSLFARIKEAKLLVLHLKNLSPRQRVRINIHKLRQYNILGVDDDVDAVLAMTWEDRPDSNPKQWIKEIHRLAGAAEHGPRENRRLSPGHIKLEPDGRIRFFDEEQKRRFGEFQRDAHATFARVLGFDEQP